MDFLVSILQQISVPDGVGATVTALLSTIILLMNRRQKTMAQIAARESIRGMANLEMQVAMARNHSTPEEREQEILRIYHRALRDLGASE